VPVSACRSAKAICPSVNLDIERLWCRIKDWRRIATRYDKLARNFLSGAYIAAIFTCWIN